MKILPGNILFVIITVLGIIFPPISTPLLSDEIFLKDSSRIRCKVESVYLLRTVYIPENGSEPQSISTSSIQKITYDDGTTRVIEPKYAAANGFLSFSLFTVYSEPVEELKNNYSIRTTLGFNNIDLRLLPLDENKINPGGEIEYRQDEVWTYGVTIGYKGWGLSLRKSKTYTYERSIYTDPNNSPYNKDIHCEYNDYQVYYFSRKHGIDFSFQDYRGYRLENPDNFYPAENTLPETVANRGDVSLHYFSLAYYYIFSNNLSLAYTFNQSERQTDGLYGSFLIMLEGTYWKLASDYSLIIPAEEPYYNEYAGLRGSRSMSFSVLPGYALSYSNGPSYCAAIVHVGGGYNRQQFDTARGEITMNGYVAKIIIKGGLGAYWDHFFFGVWVMGGNFTSYDDDKNMIPLILENFKVECYAGIRF